MNKSFRLPSRHNDPRHLTDPVPGRLAWFATLAVALTVTGLIAGCSTASSGKSSAATKTVSSSPTFSASAPASPTVSAPAPSPAASSPAPADTAGNGTEVGAYTFNLTQVYSAPLGPTAPTQSEIASGGSCDVQYNGEIYSCNSEKIISLPSGSTPTYSACTTGTIFVDGVNPTKGNAFCIIETSGQVAGVTVAGVGTSPNNYITLKVTVWKYVS
jgi:hypothetical protein